MATMSPEFAFKLKPELGAGGIVGELLADEALLLVD